MTDWNSNEFWLAFIERHKSRGSRFSDETYPEWPAGLSRFVRRARVKAKLTRLAWKCMWI